MPIVPRGTINAVNLLGCSLCGTADSTAAPMFARKAVVCSASALVADVAVFAFSNAVAAVCVVVCSVLSN